MRLYTDRWGTEKMRDFHLDGDCFVSATRGEGFGLCEFEAKLCGSRVITTGWGSAPEFLLEPQGSWTGEAYEGVEPPSATNQSQLGPYRTAEPPTKGFVEPYTNDILVGCRLTSVEGMYGIGCYDPKQKWADPDFDHLVSSMRKAAQQRLAPDLESWERLHSTHRPEIVGAQMSDALMQARASAKEDDDDDFWTQETGSTAD
jgi:hypothetical protein